MFQKHCFAYNLNKKMGLYGNNIRQALQISVGLVMLYVTDIITNPSPFNNMCKQELPNRFLGSAN